MRMALGLEVAEFVRQRSESGLDKRNVKFKKYSEAYTKSLDFKNAGKSPGDVNLTLSGDMLAALDVISASKEKIIIGYENGTPENDKAAWNVNGTYGKSKTIKKRDFMGITKKDLKPLIQKVEDEYL